MTRASDTGPVLATVARMRLAGRRAFRVNYRVYEDGSLVSWRNLRGE